MSRVVITGMGVLHPHGADPESLRVALSREVPPASGVLPNLDRTCPAGSTRRDKKMDLVGRMASCAAGLALDHAGLVSIQGRAVALVGGTMFGGLEASASFHADLVERGPNYVNPSGFPNTANNVACGQVAIKLGIKGPVLTTSNGLTSGLDAVIWGARLIRDGRASLVLAGGFDRLFPLLESALRDQGLYDRSEPSAGQVFFPSEGACFVVLEQPAAAIARGAVVHGEVAGYGQASGVMKDGRAGLARALQAALMMSGIGSPDALCLGVQGVASYDDALLNAYASVLGTLPQRRVYPKRSLGETFGASGTLSIVSAIMMTASTPQRHVLLDAMGWRGGASAMVLKVGPG